ncbi:hypothetical protein TNCV_4181181 [Trichonephila clavipes]|nr:hypothetical protein TNCV_4181181 [Trichonephila clavipes]
MDLVILMHGQLTRATPELIPPSPNYHTTPTRGHFSSRYIYRASLPCTAGLLWHWARTRDMPTMIRYLVNLVPRPQVRRQKPSSS